MIGSVCMDFCKQRQQDLLRHGCMVEVERLSPYFLNPTTDVM